MAKRISGLVQRGLRAPVDRRRLLQASGAAGIALGSGPRFGSGAGAQEIAFSRDYEGTTLNLLMEDLQETTIIEEMLPEFTDGNSPWLLQARAQLDAEDKSGALATLAAWRAAGGWEPEATRRLATLLDEAGRGPEALAVLEAINYSDPLRGAGHRELGERLLAANRADEAAREFRVLLAI